MAAVEDDGTAPGSVTDYVAVPQLRLPIYHSVTVSYGAQKRCYGRLKKVLRLDLQGGPSETDWGPPAFLSGTTPCPRKWKLFWGLLLLGTTIVGVEKLFALALINNPGNFFL
jgi:hypothetical protein